MFSFRKRLAIVDVSFRLVAACREAARAMPKLQWRITDHLRCRPRQLENNSRNSSEQSRKLVIVGDAGCGKTSLLSVFSTRQALDDSLYVPTIYDSDGFVHLEVHVDKSYVKIGSCFRIGSLKDFVKVELNLWDTGGQEELDRIRRLSYPDADVVLICFAVDDPVSFRNVLEKWVPEVRHFCGKVPIILVGTKNDLRDSLGGVKMPSGLKQRAVERDEIGKMAESIRAFAHFESSAKTGQHVFDIFDAATRAALGEKRNKPKCKLFSL